MTTEATDLRLLELMLTSRSIDDHCAVLLADGVPVPNYHSARGQEAMYAAAGVALHAEDYLLYNYRAFATLLGAGVPVDALMADLLLRSDGTSRGHGGIMHVVSKEHGILGRNGVFGSKFGHAVGMATALRVRRQRGAVLCMFGEAEGNRGSLYESLNIACLRQLPIVFLAENNGFAVGARTKDIYCSGDMSGLFRGFPLPVSVLDGNDAEAAHAGIPAALDHARAGLGPAYIECVTYRVDSHHATDKESMYRSRDEVEPWLEKDPIRLQIQRLMKRNVARSVITDLENAVTATVGEATRQAVASPVPSLDGVLGAVYYSEVAVRT